MQTILNTEFRIKLLEEYFPKNTLYLGLWYSNTVLTENEVLSSFTDYELTYSEYERISIPKYDWIIDDLEMSAYLNRILYFNPLLQNWNISGYFLCNSNKLIEIVKFPDTITLEAGQYLTISPKIYCGGIPISLDNDNVTTEVIVDYIANGDYFAGYPTLILATGSMYNIIEYTAYGYFYAGLPLGILADGNI